MEGMSCVNIDIQYESQTTVDNGMERINVKETIQNNRTGNFSQQPPSQPTNQN